MEYENVKPLNSEFLILYRSYAFQLSLPEQRF